MSLPGVHGRPNPHSAPIHHFHRQDDPSQQAKPPPRRGATAEPPLSSSPQQGPDLLLGWQTQQGHMGVHHLYNCHLKVHHQACCLSDCLCLSVCLNFTTRVVRMRYQGITAVGHHECECYCNTCHVALNLFNQVSCLSGVRQINRCC